MPFSGAVTRKRMYNRAIDGNLSFSGSIGERTTKRLVGGILSFSGDMTSFFAKRFPEGSLSFSGIVTRIKNGIPVGVVKKFNLILGRPGISLENDIRI